MNDKKKKKALSGAMFVKVYVLVYKAESFDLSCFQDRVYVRRLEKLCDTVVHLDSFVGSDKEKNPVYKEYHGMVLSTVILVFKHFLAKHQGPVVQSIVSLTSSLRVISLTVLADLIYNILIFFAEKM